MALAMSAVRSPEQSPTSVTGTSRPLASKGTAREPTAMTTASHGMVTASSPQTASTPASVIAVTRVFTRCSTPFSANSAMIVGRMVPDSPVAICSSISTMATWQPRASRYSAVSVPTRPPPMTATRPLGSALPASTSHAEKTLAPSAPGTGSVTFSAPTAAITASNPARSAVVASWPSLTSTPSAGSSRS